MMDGFDKAFTGAFRALVIIGIAVGLFISLIVWLVVKVSSDSDPIKVKQRIEPKIEITIENGIADTVYVYEHIDE